MKDPKALRQRIESAKADLARVEGERDALQKNTDEQMVQVRKILGCKKGEEKTSLAALKAKIAKDQEEIGALLDQAEQVRDGETEQVSE